MNEGKSHKDITEEIMSQSSTNAGSPSCLSEHNESQVSVSAVPVAVTITDPNDSTKNAKPVVQVVTPSQTAKSTSPKVIHPEVKIISSIDKSTRPAEKKEEPKVETVKPQVKTSGKDAGQPKKASDKSGQDDDSPRNSQGYQPQGPMPQMMFQQGMMQQNPQQGQPRMPYYRGMTRPMRMPHPQAPNQQMFPSPSAPVGMQQVIQMSGSSGPPPYATCPTFKVDYQTVPVPSQQMPYRGPGQQVSGPFNQVQYPGYSTSASMPPPMYSGQPVMFVRNAPMPQNMPGPQFQQTRPKQQLAPAPRKRNIIKIIDPGQDNKDVTDEILSQSSTNATNSGSFSLSGHSNTPPRENVSKHNESLPVKTPQVKTVGKDVAQPKKASDNAGLWLPETEPEESKNGPRLIYDRDFLLQFQFDPVCTEKPEGLPDIEVVLKTPVYHRSQLMKQPFNRMGGSGGVDFMMPSYMRQRGQGPKENKKETQKEEQEEKAGSEEETWEDKDEKSEEVIETIPTEILARGPEALKAYEEALEDGKTKNRRLVVMAVGPARAGKTSLLKSFNGEEFDPKEDSTNGIQHTVCKAQENCWSKDSDEGILYTDCMADVICENLRGENDTEINTEVSKRPIEKSMELSETLTKNDDVDNGNVDDNGDDDGDDVGDDDGFGCGGGGGDGGGDACDGDDYDGDAHDHDGDDVDNYDVNITSSPTADSNEETNKLENQEYKSAKNTSNLPKSIEEKVCDKLKDTKSDKTKENELYIKTVDFAGQAVYNVIHPIFLTSKAVFILVYNLKNILNDTMKSKVEVDGSKRELVDPFEMTNLENLELWLSCISSYTDAQKMPKVGGLSLPPVFIAGTHADEFDGNVEAAKQIIRQIYKSLSPNKNPCGCHVKCDEIYTVNNKKSRNGEIRDESVRKLKTDIEKLSKSLPHMNEDIPIRWLWFEEKLSDLVEKENKKYITIDEAMEIASECKVKMDAESKEFTTLLTYMHDLKSIIYFEETKLVFIDTKWLVEVFTKVIEVRPVERRGGFHESWDKLEEEGVLERALVEHVWKSLVDEQNTIDSLLLIMEKFSLICRWSISEGENVYLVPAMLCNSKKREDIAKVLNHQRTSAMVIRFNTAHLSLGIFPRLFITIAEEEKNEWPNLRQPKLHKNFCRIFSIGKERKLDICIIQSSPQTISVTVYNKQNIEGQHVIEFCQHFRKLLVRIFDDMRRNFPWMENMTFEYGILCPVCARSPNKCEPHGMEGCTRDSCLHFVNENELIADQPECDKDVAALDNVIEEEAYSYWFPRQVADISAFNLTENQKRWLVIGISLNVVLLPPLRKFLESNIQDLYTNLKTSNHIDNQVYRGQLVTEGKCKALNYRSVNNNGTVKGEKNYDYNVTSAVDLGKLYLQPHMAKFTGFDDTCDLSAVLGILSSASVFSCDVQHFSSQVRGEVRNEWGHCKFESWDETKFADSFKLMHSLLNGLKLPSDDEKTVADQLTDWENKGVEICTAKTVAPDLVKDIGDKVTQLSQEFKLALSRNEENVAQLSQDVKDLARQKEDIRRVLRNLETVQDAIHSLKQRMGRVEEEVGIVKKEVGRAHERVEVLEDRVKVLEATKLK